MTTEPFQFPVRVYYEDTDAQGVVYYANYFRFMERARTEWLEVLGVNHVALMQEENRILVVSDTHAKFIEPARLSDSLIVTAALTKLGRASFELEQKIYRDSIDGTLLVHGGVTAAYVAADSMRPKRIPKNFFEEKLS